MEKKKRGKKKIMKGNERRNKSKKEKKKLRNRLKVFQQPWHGFVPGELVVSVLGCRSRVASSSPAVWKKKFFGFYAVISSVGGIPFISN